MNNTSSEKKHKDSNWFRRNYLILMVVSILLVWSATLLLLYPTASKTVGDTGKFGDMFGAVNALFSGLAFAGMIYAIRLQSKELAQTNREMEVQNEMLALQKDELSETRKEFKKQNETMALQRFETTFFHLLEQHNKIVVNLIYNPQPIATIESGKDVKGRQVITHLSRSILNGHDGKYTKYTSFKDNQGSGMKATPSNVDDSFSTQYLAIKQVYKKYFNWANESSINHYFRNLYHVFKFIYQSDELSVNKKKFYVSLAVAQLSQEEQVLIFYNMMIPKLGFPKFMFLNTKLDILGNLNKNELKYFPWQLELFEELSKIIPSDFDINQKSDLVPNFDS